MKLVALGTYDLGKPRMRILLRGLQENGVEVVSCHQSVWGGIEDKSQLRGIRAKLAIVLSLLSAYPRLIWRYMKLPKHDVVLIGYLGLFDVLVLWPFIKMRRVPLVWDVFLSLYNTVVEDRRMVSRYNPVAWTLYFMEWLALRLVDIAIIDTEAHADYLRSTYRRTAHQVQRVFVGVEPEVFEAESGDAAGSDPDRPFRVVFYGQFIPLHGIDTVVRAASLCEHEDIEWLLIGQGQESENVSTLIEVLRPARLRRIDWVQYEELVDYLKKSDVALGIFGDTDKAARVIPNKVYQILAAEKPLITRDSAAIRELIEVSDWRHILISQADPQALLDAVLSVRDFMRYGGGQGGRKSYREKISPFEIGRQFKEVLLSSL